MANNKKTKRTLTRTESTVLGPEAKKAKGEATDADEPMDLDLEASVESFKALSNLTKATNVTILECRKYFVNRLEMD